MLPRLPRTLRGGAFAALLFLLVQLGALALVPTFYAQGYQTVEDPSDPTNSLLYVGAILVATALMLAAFKFGFDWVVRALIVLTSGLLAWYVFGAVLPPVLGGTGRVLALLLAAVVPVALWIHPEWYVVDGAGVLMGAGAGGLFGISFGLLPAIVLLSVLAVYDAISVYRTEHMLDLAAGVMDLRIPVVLVVPFTLSYSLLAEDFSGEERVHGDEADRDVDGDHDRGDHDEVDADEVDADTGTGSGPRDATPADAAAIPNGEGRPVSGPGSDASDAHAAGAGGDSEPDAGGDSEPDADGPEPGDRDAFFIGLGDAVMPTVMVASAAFFSPAASLGVAVLPALNLPALASMVGTFAGLVVLLRMVLKGRAHAGLPLLNGGAIGGYLLGSVLAGVPLVEAVGLAGYL